MFLKAYFRAAFARLAQFLIFRLALFSRAKSCFVTDAALTFLLVSYSTFLVFPLIYQ